MLSFNFCGVRCANQVILCLLGSNHCHFYNEKEEMCLAHNGASLQTAVTALIVLSLPFSLLLLNLSFHPSAPPFPFALSTWLWNARLFWHLQRYISLCSFHCLFPCFLHFSYSAGCPPLPGFAVLCPETLLRASCPAWPLAPSPLVFMWVCVFRTLQRVLLCIDLHREWVGDPSRACEGQLNAW